jgi:hypothetical protein
MRHNLRCHIGTSHDKCLHLVFCKFRSTIHGMDHGPIQHRRLLGRHSRWSTAGSRLSTTGSRIFTTQNFRPAVLSQEMNGRVTVTAALRFWCRFHCLLHYRLFSYTFALAGRFLCFGRSGSGSCTFHGRLSLRINLVQISAHLDRIVTDQLQYKETQQVLVTEGSHLCCAYCMYDYITHTTPHQPTDQHTQ